MKAFVKWSLGLSALVAGAAAILIFLVTNGGLFRSELKRYGLRVMRERFNADVQLSNLHIALYPGVRIEGTDLVIRDHFRTDVPPLLTVKKFSLNGDFVPVVRKSRRFRTLTLEGMHIQVPPREPKKNPAKEPERSGHGDLRFIIDEVRSQDAELDMLRRGDKPALVFLLHHLKLKSVQPDAPMSFHATLTNPKPVGEIESHGDFGPWDRNEPGLTPVSGEYSFSDADLSTIRGISGTLSSKGKFDGVLDYINVQGETRTPNFALSVTGHAVPLNTTFNAIVDGTNGNTTLKAVRARFLKSTIVASGQVEKRPGETGRYILMQATSQDARVEDLLYLAVKSPKPILKGLISLSTKLAIAPRKDLDMVDRLNLEGRFGIRDAEFTSASVQGKIDALSRRGRGEPQAIDDESAISSLEGDFKMKEGAIAFSKLTFGVEGAVVALNGSYNLKSESLDFQGALRLQARLSQTTTGVKSFFLKVADPLFKRKDAGTVLAIKVTGTREKPSFGVDMRSSIARKVN